MSTVVFWLIFAWLLTSFVLATLALSAAMDDGCCFAEALMWAVVVAIAWPFLMLGDAARSVYGRRG